MHQFAWARIFDGVVTRLVIGIVMGLLLSYAVIRAYLRRRRTAKRSFNLGSVSQQWLIIHRAEDR